MSLITVSSNRHPPLLSCTDSRNAVLCQRGAHDTGIEYCRYSAAGSTAVVDAL